MIPRGTSHVRITGCRIRHAERNGQLIGCETLFALFCISMKSVFFSPKRVSWRFPPIEEWTTTRGTPEGSHTHRGTGWRNTEADGHRSRIHNGGITGRATRWCCHTEREGWRLGSTLDHTFCFTCPCPFTDKNKTKSVHQHRGWCIGVRRKGQGTDSAPPHGRIGRNMHVQGTCPRTRQQRCPRRDNKKKNTQTGTAVVPPASRADCNGCGERAYLPRGPDRS